MPHYYVFQMLAHDSDSVIDWSRLGFIPLFGLTFHDPGCYMAYTYVDEEVEGKRVRTTFAKVGMHVMYWPIFMSIMFLYSGWISGLFPCIVADM